MANTENTKNKEMSLLRKSLISKIKAIESTVLRNDNGDLNMKTDPMQLKSYNRGKVAAMWSTIGLIDEFLENN